MIRRYLGGIAVSIFIYCNPPNALLSKKAITVKVNEKVSQALMNF